MADNIWRGRRPANLEQLLIAKVAADRHRTVAAHLRLDSILAKIAAD